MDKKKALQGGLQGLGADRGSYLLPQVVGETSGMRGREPPVIHRVETFSRSSRVGIYFSETEPGTTRRVFLRGFDLPLGCLKT